MAKKIKNFSEFVNENKKNMIFKDIEEFEKYVRLHGTPDEMKVAGKLYTMNYYDMEGRDIQYGTEDENHAIYVKTSNRYSDKKFKDAKVSQDERK